METVMGKMEPTLADQLRDDWICYGISYMRYLPDGSVERIPPDRVKINDSKEHWDGHRYS